MSTGDFVIIKPFELHTFESKKKLSNRFVSPIFPDIVSERIANRLRESVICHADGNEWGEIVSLYKNFKDMSPKNRMLYFENDRKYCHGRNIFKGSRREEQSFR